MHLELLILGLKGIGWRDLINPFDSPYRLPADKQGDGVHITHMEKCATVLLCVSVGSAWNHLACVWAENSMCLFNLLVK